MPGRIHFQGLQSSPCKPTRAPNPHVPTNGTLWQSVRLLIWGEATQPFYHFVVVTGGMSLAITSPPLGTAPVSSLPSTSARGFEFAVSFHLFVQF
jgi:hypothetical protein